MDKVLIYGWDLEHLANGAKGYATVAGVAFAIWLLVSWWRRKVRADRLDRQLRARDAFTRFCREAMSTPGAALPPASPLTVTTGSADAIRYRTYVDLLLATADEILMLDPAPQWRIALARLLAPHAALLASPELRTAAYRGLSGPTRELVDGLA